MLVLSPTLIAVTNDNNYLFDFGRHVGTRVPADNEFILVKLTNPCPVLLTVGIGHSFDRAQPQRVSPR